MEGATTSTTAVVWIAPARSADDRRALDEWAMAHGVRLASPVEAAAPVIPIDRTIAEKVEAELDRARDAVAAQETDAAERALARAEALLRAHPELPQAAWLMAEVHRQWATRWNRLEPRDKARADAAWQNAAALDGGRVAGVGETPAPAAPPAHARVLVDAASEATTVVLDGLAIVPGDVVRPAGEHQLTVTEDGTVRYAAWVGVGEGTVIKIALPAAPACSSGDLVGAAAEGDAIRARGVRCAAWVAALPLGAQGALRVAQCSGPTCGPLVEWRIGRGVAFLPREPEAPAAPAAPSGRWPGWATGTIFGAGVLVSMAVALVASGAFDKTQGTEPRFVNGGVRTAGSPAAR